MKHKPLHSSLPVDLRGRPAASPPSDEQSTGEEKRPLLRLKVRVCAAVWITLCSEAGLKRDLESVYIHNLENQLHLLVILLPERHQTETS